MRVNVFLVKFFRCDEQIIIVMKSVRFGESWTGRPFGWDLTDNKTLIAFIGWIITAVMIRISAKTKHWIFFAAVLTFIIFLIQHSLLGYVLDYSKINR